MDLIFRITLLVWIGLMILILRFQRNINRELLGISAAHFDAIRAMHESLTRINHVNMELWQRLANSYGPAQAPQMAMKGATGPPADDQSSDARQSS